MELCTLLAIRVPIGSQQKGLQPTGWGKADFSKNLRASLFDKDKEPSFSKIHIANWYL